jgi:sodium transport system permease protein
MSPTNVKLIFLRELRDQLRDRRTLFTIAVLPLLLYPLLGMTIFQVQQFLQEHASKVLVVGVAALPEEPTLLRDGQFAEVLSSERENRLLALEIAPSSATDGLAPQDYAEREIRSGRYDAVVYFPPDFSEQLKRFHNNRVLQFDSPADPAAEAGSAVQALIPKPQIFASTASDKSRIAFDRLDAILARWREAMVQENLRQNNLPPATTRPFEVVNTDIAETNAAQIATWSKLLPFVLLIWALTGAFYPAIDLCAGEKERGTLETLLSSPAKRSEIVCGKLLTVMSFSMATALLNLGSMCATGAFIITQLKRMGGGQFSLELGPPPLAAIGWLILALIPISALFSALSLAIAAFARSSKEGQYYLMPLLLISLPLMTLPMLPNSQLDLGFALIPITGMMLLLRALIEGHYWDALRYFPFVTGVTVACCWLSIRWAIDQFNNESVLFRESERFDVGLWVRQLVRDRQETPTFGEAILCGILLLMIRFFSNLLIPMPTNWNQMLSTTLVVQVALIATPVCLMAIILTLRPLETLLLRRPSFWATIPAAGLLALLLHPAMMWIGVGIRYVYPISDEIVAALEPLDTMFASAPLWQLILLIALTPAICEELAFRGFILSGLRRMGHKWGAIVISSIFFGLAHGLLQQSLSACVVGMVLGYIAVKTGSLWPGVLYHFVHNSIAAVQSHFPPDPFAAQPLLRYVFTPAADGEQMLYTLPATIVASLLAAGILLWLKSLPYRASAEERLQDALDHQTPSLLPGSSASSLG